MSNRGVACVLSLCLIVMTRGLNADDKLVNKSVNRGANKSMATSTGQSDQLVMRFKTSPLVDSQVVRLGDLVEIVSWGSKADEDLMAFPLGPAPQPGKYQDWTADDLTRNLEFRGLSRSKVAWQGPQSVRLVRKQAGAATGECYNAHTTRKMTPALLNDRVVAQAEANLVQVTREYLSLQTNERTPWRIGLKVPNELANSLSQIRNIISMGGGEEPWTGRQRLVYLIKHQGEEVELTMTVNVELPTTVVVASRAIRRDEVIDESCLMYAPLPERMEEQGDQYFDDMSQLVGKQMRRAVSSGIPIPRTYIGQPNVISGGEIVEIESVSGSVVVKSAAKALGGGAVGELINVELIPGRKRVVAMVVDSRLVRINGKGAAKIEPEADLTNDAPRAPAIDKTARNTQASGALR